MPRCETRIRAVGALLAGFFLLGGWIPFVPPTAGSSGGPDAYGYVWVDSRPPSPTIPFLWADITSAGTQLTMTDDGCTYEVPIGFAFRFYGIFVNQVFICSNGFITFEVPDSFFADPPIPSPNPPNDRIVALGVDLDPSASGSGRVYFLSQPATLPHRFIVTWQRVYKAFTTEPQTFQIILEQNAPAQDGRVILQYKALTGIPSALVGIENGTGISGLAYPNTLGNDLAIGFLPPSDAGLPPDRLIVTPTVLAPPTAAQGDGNVGMLALDLTTSTNWVDVASIRTRLSGIAAGPADVPRASLWLESNGDGIFTPGTDGFLASAAFTGSPSSATLDLIAPLRIDAGIPRRVYVAVDIASSARINTWVGARLENSSSVLVTFPDLVSSSGFPIDSYQAGTRTRILASSDTLELVTATARLPTMVPQWDMDRPVLSLRLAVDRNGVDLAGMHVPLGGNATAQDVWALKILNDKDGDGNYTPGVDDVLGVGAPAGLPLAAVFAFNLTVVPGAPVTLLLLLDVAPDAIPGHNLSVTLQPSDIILPPGSSDRVDVTNFPVATANATITPGQRPTLRVPWSAVPPAADGVWRANEYVLGPNSTASLARPAGNRVPGFLTVENNDTMLFVAIAATQDLVANPGDGAAIGFDTDLDGAPTDGADDVFAVNATQGSHDRYNASVSGWVPAGPCLPGPNASVATCAAAIGVTQVAKTAHRFYEFAVPLAILGVPSPIPPGATLRFALASAPYDGLTDRGNRSTWPLRFNPRPSLGYFGQLLLNTGPTPNRAPSLNWTGGPGYVTDALEPERGLAGDAFLWKIAYFDPDNDPPSVDSPLLHLLRNGIEMSTGPYQMTPQNRTDYDYTDGRTYERLLRISECGGTYTYFITTRDARGLPASSPSRPGPIVDCPNAPPVLWGESVLPFVGTPGTAFVYRVAYEDAEGTAPTAIDVFVRRGGVDVGSAPLQLVGWLGQVGNYTQGAWFEASFTLTDTGTNYTFQFRASDGNSTTTTSWILGPYVVVPPPDRLMVQGSDLAPPIADAGERLVPFLRFAFYALDAEVNVTSLRVDQVGAASVDTALLYEDVDGSASLTPSDVLLDVRAGSPGQIAFNFSLTVRPAAPVYALLLGNFTRPGTGDATVGYEIRDSSYISVGPNGLVEAFSPIRSSFPRVNVAPTATGLSVDGYAVGNPGIDRIASGAPTFAWQFQDSNINDSAPIAYNASVWPVPSTGAQWYLNESRTVTTLVYGGPRSQTEGRTSFECVYPTAGCGPRLRSSSSG